MNRSIKESLECQGNDTGSVEPFGSSVSPPPKRKRGRPRKKMPENISLPHSTTSSVPHGRRPKKSFSRPPLLGEDRFGLYEDDIPFQDDELSTLEEFEAMADIATNSKPTGTTINRLDQPSRTPPSVPRRKKVARRRQIDPATCERDYSRDEIEFMNALSEYKRSSGRMFPTCSEILEVLKNLGYEKKEEYEV